MATSTSTSDNSKKSFFKDYLVYNLSRNSKLLCISCVLSAIALLCLTFAAANKLNPDFTNNITYLTMLSGMAIEGLLILSFAAGIAIFKSCTRKNFTDTLLSLPLTHCQRFWGDLLTGFIASAAPVIPFGVIAVIIAAIMPYDGIAEVTARYSAAVFFAAAFMYCISVLAAIISGRTGKSYVIGIMLLLDTVSIIPLWGIFFSFCVIGVADIYNISPAFIYDLPTPLILKDFIELLSSYDTASSVQNHIYTIGSPLIVLLYIAEIAAVIALCYFLSKHRKPENTGNSFAIKKAFTVVNVLTAVAAAGLGLVITRCYSKSGAVLALVGAVVFAAAVIIGEVAIQQWSDFKKRGIVYLAALAATSIFAFTADATYGFGRSYYIPSGSKIEKIVCTTSDNITTSFTSQESISQICAAHKEMLSENIEKLDKYSPSYYQFEELKITYELKNGRELVRYYFPNADMLDNEELAEYYQTARLLKLFPSAADSFAEKYANEARGSNPPYASVYLDGIKGRIMLSNAQYKEFAEIFADDVKAHFNTDELPVGKIYIYANDDSKFTVYYTADEEITDYYTGYISEQFEILASYADTIAYLHSCTEQINENAELYEYKVYISDPRYASFSGRIEITADDLALAPVKELVSLMKTCNPYDYETSYSPEVLNSMIVTTNYFNIYYIPTDDIPRAVELATEIIKLKLQS